MLIESGTVTTVITERDDRLNRNIDEQRHLFQLGISSPKTGIFLSSAARNDLGDVFSVDPVDGTSSD